MTFTTRTRDLRLLNYARSYAKQMSIALLILTPMMHGCLPAMAEGITSKLAGASARTSADLSQAKSTNLVQIDPRIEKPDIDGGKTGLSGACGL